MTEAKPVKLTRRIARKVLETVDQGLCSGVGQPVAGQMCIEAAVCFALGLPHGDEPPCVGKSVRSFKITLNDAQWSSNAARAKGMRKLAVAQLGSDGLDQMEFSKRVALRTVQVIAPEALRAAASCFEGPDKDELLRHADLCAAAPDLNIAARAASAASISASAASISARAARAARAAASAAARAASAAASAADRAASAADRAADWAASTADWAASAAARAASAAAGAADRAARAADWAADRLLILAAELALQILIDMESPGCKWMDLFEKEVAA